MGRLFLVDLKERQVTEQPFYICRACRTHIALEKDWVDQDSEDKIGIFKNVVNVVIDGPAHYQWALDIPHISVPCMRVSNCYCVKCNQLLGTKIVQVLEDEALTMTNLKLGMHHMMLDKLLVKDGDQLFYANDWEPYQDV